MHLRYEGHCQDAEGEGERLELVVLDEEPGGAVVDGEPRAHAEDPHAGDKGGDVLHVGVAIRVRARRPLGAALDAEGQNELVASVGGRVNSLGEHGMGSYEKRICVKKHDTN